MSEIKTSMFLIIVFVSISLAQSKDSIKTKIPSMEIQPKGLDYNKKSNDTQRDTLDYPRIEQMPEPIGGIAGIQKRMKYPRKAMLKGVEGKVYILADVDEFGDVTKVTVLAGIGSGCDEEALRAVKETKFIPGRNKGKNVSAQVVIPTIFRLK